MKYLTISEVHNLLTEARKHSKRDWMMLLLAYRHGLRASEVVGIKGLKKENFASGKLYVERLKHSETTLHPLFPSTQDILDETEIAEYVDSLKNGDYLFIDDDGSCLSRFQFYRIMQKYCKRVGIHFSASHPHALKHSIAKQNIGKMGIEKMQKFLGHKNINSTAQYIKCTDDEACAAMMESMR